MEAGGGHWSAVACRRSNWRDSVFVVEHYDSSGDVELNADAAGLVGSALAERFSELLEQDSDRIEVWRMACPQQHNASCCGLTAASYVYQLFVDHVSSCSSPPRGRGAPKTPAGVAALGWEQVEALRREAARVWAPAMLQPNADYVAELSGEAKPTKLCTQHCEVVFDIHEEEEEEDVTFDSDEDEDGGGVAAAPGAAGASPLAAFLSAAGIPSQSARLLCRSTSLKACAELAVKDRHAPPTRRDTLCRAAHRRPRPRAHLRRPSLQCLPPPRPTPPRPAPLTGQRS